MKNEPGVLYSILQPFAARRLNLTKIESRPTKRRPWEYVNFVDFEATATRMMSALSSKRSKQRCQFLKILGSYPAALRSRSCPCPGNPSPTITSRHRALRAGQAHRGARARVRPTDVIKLASNENPLPPSERSSGHRDALPHLNRYPDGSATTSGSPSPAATGSTPTAHHGQRLERAHRAHRAGLPAPGEEAVIPHPSFVVYPMIVQAAGDSRGGDLKDHRLDLEAMARAITPMTKLVFVANPNNRRPPWSPPRR